MARGLKLTSAFHDLNVVNGALETAIDIDKIAQDIKTRLLSSRGEFVLDSSYGFPYQEIFVNNQLNIEDIESEVKFFILNTDGVNFITRFILNYDSGRVLNIDFAVSTIFGEFSSEVLLNVRNG